MATHEEANVAIGKYSAAMAAIPEALKLSYVSAKDEVRSLTSTKWNDDIANLNDGTISPADERASTWQSRIMLAPGALSLIALGNFTGSSVIELDFAAALASICLLFFASLMGVGVPICRFFLTKRDLDWRKALKNWKLKHDVLAIEVEKIRKNGDWFKRKDPWDEITSEFSYGGRIGDSVPKNAVPKDYLDKGLQRALTELHEPLNRLSKALEKTEDVSRVILSIETQRDFLKNSELILFWLSVVPLLLAVVNPIWVLSFGPMFEWKPAGLELARAAGK